MIVGKINLYLFSQIFKNILLILFIFLTVSWLLQITRLLTVTNFMNIEIFDIVFLSFFLIPNIITVITPFIIIFGLLLLSTAVVLSFDIRYNPFGNNEEDI